MRPQLGDQCVKIMACESPFERLRGSLITGLESHLGPPERAEVWKIAGREQLALDNGEVDLDLVQPTGMDRCMNQNNIGSFGFEPVSSPPATMGRAIIGDQEHTVSGTIRLLAHDLSDKAFKRGNAGLALTAPKQLGAMDIPRGEIGECAASCIFVLDTQRTSRRRG